MIDRYDVHFDPDDRFEMRKVLFPAPAEGVWVRWEDHIADTCKLRDKLLELAAACANCDGTGVVTIMAPPDSRLYSGVQISREVECPSCLDIRELL